MIDLAVAVVGGLALVTTIIIVVRKFPTLASIDTKVIPAERHGELKARLIEERLKRRMSTAASFIRDRLRPFGTTLRTLLRGWYERLVALEQRYRSRLTTSEPVGVGGRERRQGHAEELLAGAEESLRSGNFEDAEKRAVEALSIDPRYAKAYRLLAALYIEQKDFEHARETLEFLIQRLHVEDDELYAELGQVASGEGKFEEAKNDLEKSIALNSQVAEHYLDLCRVNLALGDSGSGFENCRRAVELEPNNPKFLNALVDASIIAGKREWAQETLEKLRTVNPENQKLRELASRIDSMPRSRRR